MKGGGQNKGPPPVIDSQPLKDHRDKEHKHHPNTCADWMVYGNLFDLLIVRLNPDFNDPGKGQYDKFPNHHSIGS